MNRDNSSTQFADNLSKEAGMVDKQLAASRSNSEIGSSSLDKAKSIAMNISDKADSWNPDSQARARGLGGVAAGVTNFYSGNEDPRIQKFRGLYQSIAGQQIAHKPTQPALEPQKQASPQRTAMQDQSQADAIGKRRGSEITGVSPLDYLLRKEKISLQDYYKAQNDPGLYQELLKKGGYI